MSCEFCPAPRVMLAPGADRPRGKMNKRRLETIVNREVSCYSISSKRQVNIDVTLRWLCARSPSSSFR